MRPYSTHNLVNLDNPKLAQLSALLIFDFEPVHEILIIYLASVARATVPFSQYRSSATGSWPRKFTCWNWFLRFSGVLGGNLIASKKINLQILGEKKPGRIFFYCGLVISTPQNRLRGPSDYWGFCFYSKSACMRAMCLCRKPHGVWVPYSHAVVLIGDYFYKLMTLLWWNINYGYSFRETEREKKSFVSHHWKCQY